MKPFPLAFHTASLMCLLVIASGCTRTHHSSIRIDLPDKQGDAYVKAANTYEGADLQKVLRKLESDYNQQAMTDYATVEKTMNDLAIENELHAIPAAQYPSMRLKRISTASKSNEKILYFQELHPPDPRWPIQVLVWFDPDNPLSISIDMGEGYHRQPSERLKQLHSAIQSQMVRHFGDRVKSSLD